MNDTTKHDNNGIYFQATGIDKKYPGVHAVNDVSLEIRKNETLGLAGENGAGKSTFLKIVSGVENPDKGEMVFKDKEYDPSSFSEANELGVSLVFQDLNLVPNLTIYENLFLSHEDKFNQLGFLNKSLMASETRKYLNEFDLNIDPSKTVGHYSTHEKQMLEIIRAFVIADLFDVERPLILLDEPTAGLPDEEREILLNKIRSFSKHGDLVFVSHRLSELMEVCDRILVLKDGELVGEVTPSKSTENDVNTMMVGRDLSHDFYQVEKQKKPRKENIVLEVDGLTIENEFKDVSFQLRKGEILGVGGLHGSGKKELGKLLFGIGDPDKGEININGRSVHNLTIKQMTKQGVGYVPAERKEYGIINSQPVTWNISLTNFSELKSDFFHFLSSRKEDQLAASAIEQFQIKATKKDLCYSLSGGNQQKIALAKWLVKDLNILILNNPTQGIDVGAKEEVYTFIRDMAGKDLSIILITDDLLELIGLSNRIITMNSGEISATVEANTDSKPSEEELLQHMI